MPRRAPGSLLPIEVAILDAVTRAARDDEPELHGFAIAQRLQERDGARRLTAHGTLYKALGRLESSGVLESRWEDPGIAAEAGRPRRRLYRVTPLGAATFARARAESATPAHPAFRPGVVA